jgi:ABC-type uncharacterized transport system auxiliary subunit
VTSRLLNKPPTCRGIFLQTTTVVAILVLCLLQGCVSLPGSDTPAPARYTLQGPVQACTPGACVLALGVVQVAAGLDTDRIARVQVATGEFTYLRDLRWVDSAGSMLEQRLAADLECRGIAVQTGHRTRSGQSQLLCELRALNLLEAREGDVAEVALSCVYRGGDGGPEQVLLQSARVPLEHWSGTAAVQALSAAYAEVFDGLYAGIPQAVNACPS